MTFMKAEKVLLIITHITSLMITLRTSLDVNEARDDGGLGCSGISWTTCSFCTSL